MAEYGRSEPNMQDLRGRRGEGRPDEQQSDLARWEEIGFAFCYALNRMKLEQAGFRFGDDDGQSPQTDPSK